jgi:uncharacterized protein with GYD domain
MAMFFLFGKYTTESIKDISIDRTQRVIDAIRQLDGKVNAMHVLLGAYDLLICVELPGVDEAVKASVAVNRLTGISFTTCPAITVETFDRLVSEK